MPIMSGGGTATGTFTDLAEISNWATDGVSFGIANGLTVGSDSKISPKGTLSRAEAGTVILHLLQKAELVDLRTED